jgi:hypothetical protein
MQLFVHPAIKNVKCWQQSKVMEQFLTYVVEKRALKEKVLG